MILPAFFPYQQRWLCDRSQFKIGLWARQTGKDFTCAAEAVLDCRQHKTHWLILAAGERQARESLEKAKYWAHQFHSLLLPGKARPLPPVRLVENAHELRFPN